MIKTGSRPVVKGKQLAGAVVTYLGLCIRPDVLESDMGPCARFILNITGSFRGFDPVYILLFPCLILLYRYIDDRTGDDGTNSRYIAMPAALFSLFMIFGYSYHAINSWHLVMGLKNGQFIKSAFIFCGYYILFCYCIRLLYHMWDHPVRRDRDGAKQFVLFRRYCDCIRKRPFLTAFLTLLLAYIPYAVISYPGIFMGDTGCQIYQMYPELGIISPVSLQGRLLSEDVYLNTSHPVIHTLLIHGCIELGYGLFRSANTGIMIYSVIQWLMVICSVSFAVKILLEEDMASEPAVIVLMFYYIVSPIIQNYMFLITKDIIYSVFLLYLLIGIYLLLSHSPGRGVRIWLPAAVLGFYLFRNEAKYVIVAALMVLIMFCGRTRKKAVVIMLAVLCFSAAYSAVLIGLKVTPGSVREMLFIPFQQTARYVRNYPDEITEEERQAIDGVLDCDMLAEIYDPRTADPVKSTYREEASSQELMAYFKAWAGMFVKHPEAYIHAVANNKYRYFYPVYGITFHTYEPSERQIGAISSDLAQIGRELSYPHKLSYLRIAYQRFREGYAKIPPVSLLMVPAVYTWILILLSFYNMRNKCGRANLLLLIPWLMVLICMAGPRNGEYGRYVYPFMLCEPFLIPADIRMNRSREM